MIKVLVGNKNLRHLRNQRDKNLTKWHFTKMVTVVTVTEVTVFSGGGIGFFENFQIVSNNNR